MDIVSKFEPTILCDMRSWDYTLFPPGHFDMVWASPVCAEYSRALTMRPRRLEDWCSEPSRSWRISTLMWVIENPATGLLKTQVRDSVQEADPTVDQHALETEPRATQERQPVRRVGGREASEGRSRGASTHGRSA